MISFEELQVRLSGTWHRSKGTESEDSILFHGKGDWLLVDRSSETRWTSRDLLFGRVIPNSKKSFRGSRR